MPEEWCKTWSLLHTVCTMLKVHMTGQNCMVSWSDWSSACMGSGPAHMMQHCRTAAEPCHAKALPGCCLGYLLVTDVTNMPHICAAVPAHLVYRQSPIEEGGSAALVVRELTVPLRPLWASNSIVLPWLQVHTVPGRSQKQKQNRQINAHPRQVAVTS
jgi:hypothetical protein